MSYINCYDFSKCKKAGKLMLKVQFITLQRQQDNFHEYPLPIHNVQLKNSIPIINFVIIWTITLEKKTGCTLRMCNSREWVVKSKAYEMNNEIRNLGSFALICKKNVFGNIFATENKNCATYFPKNKEITENTWYLGNVQFSCFIRCRITIVMFSGNDFRIF